MSEPEIVTLKTAAAQLGITASMLRHECQYDHGREGRQGALARRLNARRIGRDWYVDRDALQAEIDRRANR